MIWTILAGLQLVLAGLVAAMFGFAAIAKWRDPTRFGRALAGQALLPAALRPAVAQMFPWAEAACAGALVALPFASIPHIYAAALLALLALAMAAVLLRSGAGGGGDCGCGPVARPVDLRLVVRNLLLAIAVALPPVTALPPMETMQALLAGALLAVLGLCRALMAPPPLPWRT